MIRTIIKQVEIELPAPTLDDVASFLVTATTAELEDVSHLVTQQYSARLEAALGAQSSESAPAPAVVEPPAALPEKARADVPSPVVASEPAAAEPTASERAATPDSAPAPPPAGRKAPVEGAFVVLNFDGDLRLNEAAQKLTGATSERFADVAPLVDGDDVYLLVASLADDLPAAAALTPTNGRNVIKARLAEATRRQLREELPAHLRQTLTVRIPLAQLPTPWRRSTVTAFGLLTAGATAHEKAAGQ